jgi:hypothetical protein
LTPAQIKSTSRTKWLTLSETPIQGAGGKTPKFKAMPLREVSKLFVGTTRGQRVLEIHKAALQGKTHRVWALVEVGTDIDAKNLYGQTPLMVAAWHGHARVVKALADAGADVQATANDGSSAEDVAAANGLEEVLCVLQELKHRSGQTAGLTAEQVVGGVEADSETGVDDGANTDANPVLVSTAQDCTSINSEIVASVNSANDHGVIIPISATISVTELISRRAKHPGAGSCYIDGCFSEHFLQQLERMWQELPVADPTKASCSERRYFCDAQGWVREGIAKALAAAAEVQRVQRAREGDETHTEKQQDEQFDGKQDGQQDGQQDEEEQFDGQQDGQQEREPAKSGLAKWGRVKAPRKGTCTEAFAHMRILGYNDVGGDLPPHTDLSRTDTQGRKSTHTFLLYLADCEYGGQTVLLKSVRAGCGGGSTYEAEEAVDAGQMDTETGDDKPAAAAASETNGAVSLPAAAPNQSDGGDLSTSDQVLAAVAPVRGRLFIFPHICPHAGLPVQSLPKVLVRGELI